MYSFDLKNKELLDKFRGPLVYKYNLAQNMALLSNDVSVIREWFQIEKPKYYEDTWLAQEGNSMFLSQFIDGQAYVYFGLIPMIVNAKTNLVASAGFKCESDDKQIDDGLNKIKDDANLQDKFVRGVYWESGLGDFAYRISYDKSLSDKPLVDVIEPQFLEVNYSHGCIKSFVIKDISTEDAGFEVREIHHKNDAGFVCIDYYYHTDGHYVLKEDTSLMEMCRSKFDYDLPKDQVLPFRDYLIIYKQNANNNQLYKGRRGVPDIQGLVSIEDALSESASDLVDAIRKGGVKTYLSDELIPQDKDGNDLKFNPFNKTIITTRGSSNPMGNDQLFHTVMGDINWEAYTRTMQQLMSIGINKAGLAPTTVGLTGLESINSSAESQDAREKTSMRTREVALDSWRVTLRDLLNRYLQMLDYINGKSIMDYKDLINITFNEYTNPTLENVTNVLAKQVQTGLKSQLTAIKDLNEGMSEEQAMAEYQQIQAENQGIQGVLPDGQPNIQPSGNQRITLTQIPVT